MAIQSSEAVEARYQAGLEQIRQGMRLLSDLYRELEEQDAHASVRATLLKLLHDLDEVLLRETTPPPSFAAETAAAGAGRWARIAPHLEQAAQATEPEAGG